ncbi:MAG: hypothetical protein QOJ16_2806 [Acidobacteriota bacterium]|jgi:hypothetical protein|nr:hypothetical protein [Acidobacteriota bacterium]
MLTRSSWFLLALALIVIAPLQATPAPGPNYVLILGSSVTGGFSSVEATQATALGYMVEIATDAGWAAKSTADFASYRALILGDPDCSTSISSLAVAENDKAVWGAAVLGNVAVVGTDPEFHTLAGVPGAPPLVRGAIGFATSGAGATGLYLSLSCYYFAAGHGTPVAILSPFGSFAAGGQPDCSTPVHIVAPGHPVAAGSTDSSLSNWGCSIHELLESFPSTFLPVAIAEGVTGPGSLSFADGSQGVPYIVARGSDTLKPTCKLRFLAGPPAQVEVTLRDTGSGLARIDVTESENATESVPAFSVGTTDPVLVTATKIDPTQGSEISITATDVAGNAIICDPIVALVVRNAGKPESETLTGIPASQRFVTVANGTPGLQHLDVIVNSIRFRVAGLADGAQRTLDVSAAMVPGNNTVTLEAFGKPGGSAAVFLADSQ